MDRHKQLQSVTDTWVATKLTPPLFLDSSRQLQTALDSPSNLLILRFLTHQFLLFRFSFFSYRLSLLLIKTTSFNLIFLPNVANFGNPHAGGRPLNKTTYTSALTLVPSTGVRLWTARRRNGKAKANDIDNFNSKDYKVFRNPKLSHFRNIMLWL